MLASGILAKASSPIGGALMESKEHRTCRLLPSAQQGRLPPWPKPKPCEPRRKSEVIDMVRYTSNRAEEDPSPLVETSYTDGTRASSGSRGSNADAAMVNDFV